jgi:hypothetical protein
MAQGFARDRYQDGRLGTTDPPPSTPMGQPEDVGLPLPPPIVRPIDRLLTAALERAVDSSCAFSAELNTTLGTYVRQLRIDGLPPERMLVHIKELVYRTVQSRVDPDAYNHDHFRQFIARVVQRCIQAYYRDD